MKYIQLLVTSSLLILGSWLHAQTSYTFPTGKKSIYIDAVNKVTLIGTSDAVASVEIQGRRHRSSERTKGLKLINGLGINDNTEIGLNVSEENGELAVRAISNRSNRRYTFYIPADYIIRYDVTSPHSSRLVVEDISAELDISTMHNSIEMSGVTGPLAVHSIHGKIDATFDKVSQSGPISIYSIHGHADVSIPKETKADISLTTNYGEVYSNVDLKMEQKGDGMKKISNKDIEATLNGGGVKFSIKSDHSDIYLRYN